MKKKENERYIHYYCHDSLPPLLRDDTRILVVGSFSSSLKKEKHGYYTNHGNYMLTLLGTVCDIQKQILEDNDFLDYGIGFYDIIRSCYAPIDFSDKKIIAPIVDKKLFDVINRKEIEVVIVTGDLAWCLFCEHAHRIKGTKIIYKIPSTSNTNNHYRKPNWDLIVTEIKRIVKKEPKL